MAEKMEEKEAAQLIKQIGEQLSDFKTCPNKDTLIKLLQQAKGAFRGLKQSESLKSTVQPLRDSLVNHGLLRKNDKDIRFLVGICIREIIRILAPDPGFSRADSKDVFKLLLTIFAELNDVASPYFSERSKLLETVAKLRFCVQMVELKCNDLVHKMFKSFFSTVRDDHHQTVISSMSSIMTCTMEEILEAKGSKPQPLLDVIMQNIIRARMDGASASFRLAAFVIQNSSVKLEECICQFLISCILNKDAVESVVKDYYHEIILEIFQIAPQMLLTVMPNLTLELLTDQVDVRIKVLNLLRKFASLPGHNVLRKYHNLFVELLNRFSDKSVEVRMSALLCAKAFYTSNPLAKDSIEVLAAIQGRLLDHDDKVRIEAVNVVCELVKTNLNSAASELIPLAAERLRDKKVSVRSKALKFFIELYQEYCKQCAAGLALNNKHIEEIPCTILMLCYEKNCQEFRPQSMDLVLAKLFSASLSTEESTKHWVYMFSIFEPPHMKALKIILSQKRRVQDGLKEYLDLCNKPQEICEEQRKMKALVSKMSACFLNPATTRDCFQKLNELKDNEVFSVLKKFLHQEATFDSENTKDLNLKEFGGRLGLYEFFHLLSLKCSFNIFNSKHVQYILDCLSSEEVEDVHLKKCHVDLLLTIISAFPSLLRGLEKQFQFLLFEEKIPVNDQLIEVLAREGHCMQIELSDVYSSLEKVCLEGTRIQSKIAVSAIAALSGTSKQDIFSKLCKTLVDSLCDGQNIPTVLQSLGCLAQHSVSTFEAHEKFITKYIVEDLFQQQNALYSKDFDFIDETSACCDSCQLKVLGLKALVRSFLPHKNFSPSRSISFLLDIIQQVLQTGGFVGIRLCELDKGYVRLAAAKSVLRLSKKWDLHISPQIFRLTVMMSKGQATWICRSFADKVHKHFKNHVIPSRYACTFSYIAVDPADELRINALKYWESFIEEFVKGAQTYEIIDMQGAASHPVYLVVFLIHVLAHDAKFPSSDLQDNVVYPQFLSPLFVTLEALVVGGKIYNASSYLRNIFNAIKRAEDAVDVRMTFKLHLLAEIGICILNSLNTENAPVPRTPGPILLPSSLYRNGPAGNRKVKLYAENGYTADANFTKELISRIKSVTYRFGSIGTGSNPSKHFNENSQGLSGTRNIKSDPKSSYPDNLLINESQEQFAKVLTGETEQELGSSESPNQIASSSHESVELHKGFSSKNVSEKDPHKNAATKVLSSRITGTTRILRSRNKGIESNPTEEDTVSRYSSVCTEPSKPPSARAYVLPCSSKGLEDLRPIHCDDNSGSSLKEQTEVLGDAKQDNVSKTRESCARKRPLPDKRNKKCDADTSKSEVIDANENAIARRTRRRKL